MDSYLHGTSAVPLLGETIGANLRRTVEQFGDREALVVRHQNYRATYRQLWEQVGLAARALLARGVRTTARVGAILVNINPAYKALEVEYALNQSGVSLLALARGFRQTDYLAILAEI